jgi:hypothetical protein
MKPGWFVVVDVVVTYIWLLCSHSSSSSYFSLQVGSTLLIGLAERTWPWEESG